jgi:hypothetical protein
MGIHTKCLLKNKSMYCGFHEIGRDNTLDIPPLRLRFAQSAIVIHIPAGRKSQTPVGMTFLTTFKHSKIDAKVFLLKG